MSAQDPPAENPEGADESYDETPQQREARERAEAMIERRNHPEREVKELKRPQTVLIGCVMAWIGSVVLAYGGYARIRLDESSSLLDTVKPEDVDSQLQSYHAGGWVAIAWATMLVVMALIAFSGRRWGATGLFVLACIVVLYGLLSLVTGFAIEGVTVTLWSVSSGTLVRFREPSRDWYAALADRANVDAATT